jgi:Spy/CpxP family protein refolding chaperone
MDPVSLSLGAVVAALVAKAADRAEDGVVDAAATALSRLVNWVRTHLGGGSHSPLERLTDAPDSPSRIRALAEEIDQRASGDDQFRKELQALVEQAQSAGVDVASVSQVAWGDQNVQNANVTGSDIRVSYGAQPHDKSPE